MPRKTNYANIANPKATPQNEPIPGREKDMGKNSAGGFSFKVDKWTNLNRFLILGAEGGSYYATERNLVKDNAKCVSACIKEDGRRVVDTVIEVIQENRAAKIDPALFILAMAAQTGNKETKTYANDRVQDALNIPTHYFAYFNNVKALGSFSSGTSRAFSELYNGLDPERLGFLLAKYQSRDGVTHRDVLRQAHVQPVDEAHNELFQYAVGKLKTIPKRKPFLMLWAQEQASKAKTEKEIVTLITNYNMPQECIPTEWRSKPKVAEALLQKMPITATIRGLGKLSAAGILGPMSSNEKVVIDRITNEDILKRGKVHPFNILLALSTYKNGGGYRSSKTWTVNQRIVDALDEAYYKSFQNVEPTGKKYYLALDVSGSMGAPIMNTALTAREGAAAMAMVTARTESDYYIAGFTSGSGGWGGRWGGDGVLTELNITPKQRLDTIVQNTSGLSFGGTDCSLPMLDALKRKIEVDTFVVYTDNETWAGDIQPVQALKNYRQKMGRPAKLIVVGMTSSGFSIADPQDNSMLDCVGFSGTTPKVIADFSRGLI